MSDIFYFFVGRIAIILFKKMKEIKSDTYKWSPEFELQKSV